MRSGLDPTPIAQASAYDPAQTITVYIDDLHKTIGLVGALTKAGRKVDLAGLEHTVGVLCAKTLDLRPDEGRAVRPALIGLTAALDTLIAEMGSHRR